MKATILKMDGTTGTMSLSEDWCVNDITDWIDDNDPRVVIVEGDGDGRVEVLWLVGRSILRHSLPEERRRRNRASPVYPR
jgi:hypothetical protein